MAKNFRSLSSLLKKVAQFVFTDDMELIVRGLLANLATPRVLSILTGMPLHMAPVSFFCTVMQ